MRLREILPEISPQNWQRWKELARSVPPHDPLRLLNYPDHVVEHAGKTGDEAAIAMLDLLDGMLRALTAAGVAGRIDGYGLNGVESVYLNQPYWLLLDGLPARALRRAIDLGHHRIHLPGETVWDDGATTWDHGETRWDVGIPETDIATIEGVIVDYADHRVFAAGLEAAVGAAEVAPQAAPPPSAKPKSRKPQPPGAAARRVKLIHASEAAGGWSSKRGVEAEKLARDKAQERKDTEAIGLLTPDHPDTTARAWRAARALRNVPDPSFDEIRETLRRQRQTK